MTRYSVSTLVLFLIAVACPCLGQTATANKPATAKSPAKTEGKPMTKSSGKATLIAKEKSLWEAFKKKDAKPFEKNLSADSLQIDVTGLTTKADVLKGLADCDVKDYTLDNFKAMQIDSNVTLLTYKAIVHATCGGQEAPENILASSVWVNRGGKWMVSFHQETPVMK